MAAYLLDTSVIIDAINNKKGRRELLKDLSSITWSSAPPRSGSSIPKARTMMVHRPDGSFNVAAHAEYRCDLLGLTVIPEYRTEVA